MDAVAADVGLLVGCIQPPPSGARHRQAARRHTVDSARSFSVHEISRAPQPRHCGVCEPSRARSPDRAIGWSRAGGARRRARTAARERAKEQVGRSIESEHRAAGARVGPQADAQISEKRAQLDRLKSARARASRPATERRAAELAHREQRVAGEIARDQEALNGRPAGDRARASARGGRPGGSTRAHRVKLASAFSTPRPRCPRASRVGAAHAAAVATTRPSPGSRATGARSTGDSSRVCSARPGWRSTASWRCARR